MIKKLGSAFAALFIGLGISVAGAAPASAAIGAPNSVINTIYSDQRILICSPGDPCVTRYPGEAMFETTEGGWNPDLVAVCRYCIAYYRAVVNHGPVLSGWVTQEGGRYGTWIDAGAVHRMWGDRNIQVQVTMTGPYY